VRNGRIVGEANWRLAVLQRALREGSAPRLGDVFAASRADFDGLHYASARHLLLHAQERGALERFVRLYGAQGVSQNNGETALLGALGVPDLPTLERDYQMFVRSLAMR
jgi:hypothetical protein